MTKKIQDAIKIVKSLTSITNTLEHYEKILDSLVELSTKHDTDLQITNEKVKTLKEDFGSIKATIENIKKNTDILVAQLDAKERKEYLNGKRRSIFWAAIADFFTKNYKHKLTIAIIIILTATILLITGVISIEDFRGIVKK